MLHRTAAGFGCLEAKFEIGQVLYGGNNGFTYWAEDIELAYEYFDFCHDRAAREEVDYQPPPSALSYQIAHALTHNPAHLCYYRRDTDGLLRAYSFIRAS